MFNGLRGWVTGRCILHWFMDDCLPFTKLPLLPPLLAACRTLLRHARIRGAAACGRSGRYGAWAGGCAATSRQA